MTVNGGLWGRTRDDDGGQSDRRALAGFVSLALAVAGIIVAAAHLAYSEIADRHRQDLRAYLSAILDITERGLGDWNFARESDAGLWAQSDQVRALAEKLLISDRAPETLTRLPEQGLLRALLAPVLVERGYEGYFVVARDGTNIASSRDANLGVRNLLMDNREQVLKRIFRGEVLVTLPQESDVPLLDDKGHLIANRPTMFVGAPLRDLTGTVAGALLFRIDPYTDFTRLLQRAEWGRTGQVYAFNEDGLAISELRDTDALRTAGLIDAGAKSTLTVALRVPGVDLGGGEKAPVDLASRPLTKPVSAVLSDGAPQGTDVIGYENYLGAKVVGAWRWDADSRSGIIAELSHKEAMASLILIRNLVWVVIGAVIVLLFGLVAVLLRSRQRAVTAMQQVRAVIDNTLDGIVVVDADNIVRAVNPAACNVFGYTQDVAVGQDVATFFVNSVDFFALDGRIREAQGVSQDGKRFPVELGVSSVALGGTTFALGMVRDITERARAEERIRRYTETLAEAERLAELGSWRWDIAAGALHWSNEHYRICGLAPDDKAPSYDDFMAVVHPDDKELVEQTLAETLKEGSHYRLEHRLQLPDGTLKCVVGHGEVLRNATGEPVSMTGTLQDISVLKKVEEQVRRSQQGLADAERIAKLGSWVWELEGGDLTWSDEIFRIFGYDPGTVAPSYELFLERVHPEDRDAVTDAVNQSLENHQRYIIEHRVVRPNGEERFVEEQGMIDVGDDGMPVRMTGTVQDITERKEVERLKSEFVSTVNHELRTPLTSIQGALALIMSALPENLEPKFVNMLGIARRNAERLVRLINDILDIDKLEAGKMSFEMAAHDMYTLAETAIDSDRSYGTAKGVVFELAPDSQRLLVQADAHRLHQVFSNLLSNAAKFSPDGGTVTVAVRRRADMARVEISDRGDGIPEEFQSRIFGKFAQADGSVARKHEGTGLGLAISKAIVGYHAGEIGFDTTLGEGTTFYFEIPLTAGALATPGAAATAGDDAAFRVLVCEDDPDISRVLREMLQAHDTACDSAATAAEAKQLLAQHHYDAMTLDLMLPDQDGLSLMKELRQDDATRDLPIVVVSARAREGQELVDGDAVGIIDWLDKPIDEERLFSAIEQAREWCPQRRCRILHVEDDPELTQVVSAYLADIADVTAVASLQAARESLGAEHYDMVLLDVGLPDGSGIDLLAELRKDDGTSIPVVLFTGQDVPVEIAKRATEVLTKSQVTMNRVWEAVRRAVQLG